MFAQKMPLIAFFYMHFYGEPLCLRHMCTMIRIQKKNQSKYVIILKSFKRMNTNSKISLLWNIVLNLLKMFVFEIGINSKQVIWKKKADLKIKNSMSKI